MRKEINRKDIGTYENLELGVENIVAKKTPRQCVRCGVHLYEDQKLWCSKCLKRVDEELNGEADRPFRYYFKRNLNHKK